MDTERFGSSQEVHNADRPYNIEIVTSKPVLEKLDTVNSVDTDGTYVAQNNWNFDIKPEDVGRKI